MPLFFPEYVQAEKLAFVIEIVLSRPLICILRKKNGAGDYVLQEKKKWQAAAWGQNSFNIAPWLWSLLVRVDNADRHLQARRLWTF